jgi:hypothetical protein
MSTDSEGLKHLEIRDGIAEIEKRVFKMGTVLFFRSFLNSFCELLRKNRTVLYLLVLFFEGSRSIGESGPGFDLSPPRCYKFLG